MTMTTSHTQTGPTQAKPAPYRHGHAKLGLGCSQLGLDQAPSTPRGRPPEREAGDALQIAARADLKVLDAQVQFGRAESLIGALMPRPNPFRTIVRCVRPDRGPDHVEDELRQALRRLRLDKADTVMVQTAGDLFSPQGPAMWDRLRQLREEGLFECLGVSVFASDDPVALTRRFKPDVVQAPVSLLDQRLIVSGALAEIAGLGVEVHLRSIFLQGLLFLPPDRMPTNLRGHSGPLSRVRRLIAEGRSDPLQAALWFALSRPEAHHVIVGVTSAAELRAILAAAAAPTPNLNWGDLALDHSLALDPHRWAAA